MKKNQSKSKSPPKKKSPAPKAPKRASGAAKKAPPKGASKPGARPAPKPAARSTGARSAPAAVTSKSTAAAATTKPPKAQRKKGARPAAAAPPAEVEAVAERPAAEAQAAPRAEAAAPPPPPPPVVSDEDSDADEVEVPGEAIDGKRLALAITYALKVTPKEGELVFTRSGPGLPLVSGHDQRRCHTAFLPKEAAFELESSVPQADARRLAKALLGLVASMVRISATGEVLIRHGLGQPPMRFRLGVRPITQAWEPPSQEGRQPAAGALRISAAWQAAACRWGNAIVHTAQSADGIEWCTITDAEGGELLARAVLAEDGKDLYPEDDRQGEIPGSRTAGQSSYDRAVEGMGGPGGVGMRGGGVVGAVRDLKRTLRDAGATMTVTTGDGRSVTLAGDAPGSAPAEVSGDEEARVLVDDQPVGEALAREAEPAEERGDGRVWIAQIAWDDLSPEGLRAISDLVEPGTLTSDGTPGWIGAEVAGEARRALGVAAAAYDLTLHWGEAPPRTNAPAAPAADQRYWIAEGDWDGLMPGDYDALTALVGDENLDGRVGWVTALVPAANVAAFDAAAERAQLTVHRGEEPPATGSAGEATG